MGRKANAALIVSASAAILVVGYAVTVYRERRRRKSKSTAVPVVWKQPLSALPTDHVEMVVDCKCLIGEGTTWSQERQCLYWLDIEGKALYQLVWETREATKWPLPKRAGSLAVRAGPLEQRFPFLLAFEDGFALFNPETGERHDLESPYVQEGNVRLNDGRCDRQGRFVCGGINLENVDEPISVWEPRCHAFCMDENGNGKLVIGDHLWRNYNGTAFSPDGKTMYVTDSPLRQIWAFDYDSDTGTPSNRRIFAEVGPPPYVADGATVDAEGCVWYAKFLQGEVHRYSPAGELLPDVVKVPEASRTSCPGIGGPNLDTLFVTTLRIGYETWPKEEQEKSKLAGGLFAIRLDKIRGIAEPTYRGPFPRQDESLVSV